MTPASFYSDPLAAAWMAKHFGMRFWNGSHEIHVIPLVDGEKEGKWTIHPDSENLLNVQLGDIVSMTKAMDRYAVVNAEELRDAFTNTSDYKIIQRKGIVFHWPESEEEKAA